MFNCSMENLHAQEHQVTKCADYFIKTLSPLSFVRSFHCWMRFDISIPFIWKEIPFADRDSGSNGETRMNARTQQLNTYTYTPAYVVTLRKIFILDQMTLTFNKKSKNTLKCTFYNSHLYAQKNGHTDGRNIAERSKKKKFSDFLHDW